MTTNYLVDTNNLTGYAQVVEEIQSNAVVKTYTYGLDLISQRSAAGVNFYQYDGHGSVRGLTDTSANVTDTYAYDAFGTITERTGTTDNNYLYAGEQFDPDLGFYYNRARYLSTSTGRFLSFDSFGGAKNEPASLHKFLYGSNNPANRIDPSGNFTISEQTQTFVIHNILSTLAFSVPIRGSEAIRAYAEGASLGTVIQDALIGLTTDIGVGLALGGIFSQLPRLWKVRSIAMGLEAFRNSRVATSVWNLAAFALGVAIENTILGRLPNLSSDVFNFPVIDDFTNGVATSIKS